VEKFDSKSGKHTIAYDDGEKELLDLEEEKVCASPSMSASYLSVSSVSTCSLKFKSQRRGAQSDRTEPQMLSSIAMMKRMTVLFDPSEVLLSSVKSRHSLSPLPPSAKTEPPLSSKKRVDTEDEEEWGESNEDHSTESEAELEDSDSDSEQMKSAKKRKIGRLASSRVTGKDKSNAVFSSAAAVRSPSLPPRPAKTSADLVPSKSFDLFTPSTPSPSKSRTKPSSSPSPFSTPPPLNSQLSSPSSSSSLRGGSASASVSASLSVSEELGEGVVGYGSHEHHRWDFLHKARKDKFGRSPDHPDFNPRTIAFPPSFLKEQTPAMKQWCEVKADNFDTVLFFKVNFFLSFPLPRPAPSSLVL
jgi:hypothetical protein